jgi:Domain of unknown function (DUF4157)
MALRSHAHQKASSDTVSTTVQHTSRPFAPQAKPDAEQTQTLPELQTQVQTAQRFGHHLADFSLSSHPSSPPPIQPKLAIGAPGDKYEQEADRVAQQVVQRLNAPQVERAGPEPAVQRQTPEDEELQMKPMLQMRGNAKTGGQASPDLESAINQARGGGQSLDNGLQRSMGQAMGANFSGVRVHTDDRADQLNRSIQAKAFTTGQNVFFRQGAYQPGSRGGQELLAHELTHVVQQSGGAVQRAPQIQQTEQVGQTSQDSIQCAPWDPQQSAKEERLAERQNARVETGETQPGEHPVSIGAEQEEEGDTTVGDERHLDDDMLKTLEVVLDRLPASHINGNSALARIVLGSDPGGGRSFFDGDTLTIIVPFDRKSWIYLNVRKWPMGDLATTLLGDGSKSKTLTRDVVGTGSNLNKLKMVSEKFVEWMLRHETGHAVDRSIGWFDGSHYREPACGAWELHSDPIVRLRILRAVGLEGALANNLNDAFRPYTQAGYESISRAIQDRDKEQLNPSYRKSALKAFEQTNPGGSRLVDRAEKVIRVGLSRPYETGGGVNLNNRTYQLDYQGNTWVSYQSDKYALRNSNYQYQSPHEWFAETYAHYFTHPADKWGEKLKDPAARQWFRSNLDPVNGTGDLITGGNLVALPPHLLGSVQQGAAPPPTREAMDTLKDISISVGKAPLSLGTRAIGAVAGTVELSKIPLKYVYKAIKDR